MNKTINLMHGDCLERLKEIEDNTIDAIVTDPPYGLSFMGKKWDYDVPSVEVWVECLRVLKPGGHLLAFAGTRTQHRMAVRIEDAGFEIRDMIAWVYGSGFPKSMDVSKQLDKIDATETRRERALKFTAWIRSTGLTASRINEITNTNMGSHYTTEASQPSVATREYFEMMRPHFGCDVPDWVEQSVEWRTIESENFKRREVAKVVAAGDLIDDEREIEVAKVGVNTKEQRIAVATTSQGLRASTRHEFKITEAHTELAKKWQGWGTTLKPALEPVTVARKPLVGTVAENVVEYGTGALNIDGCRVNGGTRPLRVNDGTKSENVFGNRGSGMAAGETSSGRFPANLIHDGDEPADLLGEAARFFYCAKASKRDRDEGLDHLPEVHRPNGNKWTDQDYRVARGERPPSAESGPRRNIHPTVKPTDLMAYLCRLVTPPGGVVLDPFMGSGSTGKAAILEGFRFVGIEREAEYLEIARARIEGAQKAPQQQGLAL